MTIDELEKFFETATLPETISIKQGEKITDIPAFVKSHIEIVRRNGNLGAFSAFYDRLYLLWEIITHGGQDPKI